MLPNKKNDTKHTFLYHCNPFPYLYNMSQKPTYAQMAAKPAVVTVPPPTPVIPLSKKDKCENERRALYNTGMVRLRSYIDTQTPEEIARKVADKRATLMTQLEKQLAAYETSIKSDNTFIQTFIKKNRTYTGQCFHPTKEIHEGMFETDCTRLNCKYCKHICICEQTPDINDNWRHCWVMPYHIIHGEPNPNSPPYGPNTKLGYNHYDSYSSESDSDSDSD